jgi:hypothetical protein
MRIVNMGKSARATGQRLIQELSGTQAEIAMGLTPHIICRGSSLSSWEKSSPKRQHYFGGRDHRPGWNWTLSSLPRMPSGEPQVPNRMSSYGRVKCRNRDGK